MKKIYIFIAALSIKAGCTAQCLVAHYPFDNNINDYSGNNNNGTFTNATSVNDRLGNPNSAYSFNGINQYTELPALNFTNELTVCAWIMMPQIDTSQQDLITKYDGDIGAGNVTTMRTFKIAKESFQYGSHFDFQTTDNSNGNWHTKSTTVPVAGTWYHVAGTFNSGVSKIYVNGILENTHNDSYLLYNSAVNILCAASYSDFPVPSFFSNVVLDDVRLFDCELNASEISAVYNNTTGTNKLTPENDINVFPNPSKEIVKITCALINPGDVKIEIYDILGVRVKVIYKTTTAGKQNFSMNISDLKSGVYFLSIETEKEKTLNKLIVE